jgi:MEMO1 family protein
MHDPRTHRSAAARWAGPLLCAVLLALVVHSDLTLDGRAAPATRGATTSTPASGTVRPPAVAGQFYPGERAPLEAAVRGFLADARPARGPRPIALVAPHAGYVYSGQIAADAWRQAMGGDYDLVVLLGTNHTLPGFSGAAVSPASAFRTPLGDAVVDDAARRALVGTGVVATDARVHEREHSIEVQVPFAQIVLPRVPILPVVVGTEDPAECARIADALARALRGRRPLIVASSDLSHYPSHDDAEATDRAFLAAVVRLDPAGVHAAAVAEMSRGRPQLVTCACGEGAIQVAMGSARRLGAKRGEVLSHANSGDDAVGDPARVVGYGAVMFTGGPAGADTGALTPPAAAAPADTLTPADQAALLALARHTLERWFSSGTAPLPRDLSPAAQRPQGAFVTLFERGELRGCIGHMAEDRPLAANVAAMALAAAFEDPRFPALEASELEHVTIEISALTPLEPVSGPEAVVIGRDGVEIEKNGRRAVFLPQVPVEQGWDREALLENLCLKAGLPRDAWKSGASFRIFRSVHFREPARK